MRSVKDKFLAKNLKQIKMAQSYESIPMVNQAIKELKVYNKEKKSRKGLVQLSYAYIVKAHLNFAVTKKEDSLKDLDLAQKIFRRCKPKMNDPYYYTFWLYYAASFKLKGVIEELDGEIPEAFKSLHRGMEVLERLHRLYPGKHDVTETLLMEFEYIMTFTLKQRLYGEHIECAKKYLTVFGPLADPADKDLTFGVVYSNMGQCALGLKEYGKARKYLNRSLDYLDKFQAQYGDPEMVGIAICHDFLHLGTLAKDCKEYEESYKYYSAALDYLRSLSARLNKEQAGLLDFLRMTVLCNLADLYGFMGNHVEEKRLLDSFKDEMESYRESVESKDSFDPKEMLNVLLFQHLYIEALIELGDLRKAMDLFTKYEDSFLRTTENEKEPFDVSEAFKEKLETLRVDLTLNLINGLANKSGSKRLHKFISDNYAATEEFKAANPDVLDQGKIEDLESKFALLNRR